MTTYEFIAIDECPGCNGSGKVDILPKPVKKNCPVCKGTGKVKTVLGTGDTPSKTIADYVIRQQKSKNDVEVSNDIEPAVAAV